MQVFFTVLPLILSVIVGYLLGSINSSIILTRLFQQNEDIRKHGSGNAGMTNVLRTVGKRAAALTFVGDFLKCVAAILLSLGIVSLSYSFFHIFAPELVKAGQYLTGAACVLGHIFPLYYGFRGGKGIVTSAAMIALTDWRVFLLVIATFLIVFLFRRIISLASVTCAALYPVYTFLVLFFLDFKGSEPNACSLGFLLFAVGCSLFVGVTVLVKHRSNIERLLKGEEKPITAAHKK